MRRFALAVLLVLGCGGGPEIPVDTVLLRVASPWTPATGDPNDPRRTAPGTIVILRGGTKEFVEFHCQLLEQNDQTLYISSGHSYVTVLGTWDEDDNQARVTRKRVYRRNPPPGLDSYCAQRTLTFRVSGNSLIGDTGEGSEGTYSPVTRLVAPDFESYVDRARVAGVICADKQ